MTSPHLDGDESASIENVWLIDALQSCCFNKRTGHLKVECDGKQGSIYIHGGVIVQSKTANAEGEDAFQEMLRWNAAMSSLENDVTSDTISMSKGWEELLREWTQYQAQESVAASEDLTVEAEAGFLVGKTIGPYLIKRHISSDNWGTLYEALQIAVNRTVALRVLHPAYYGDQTQVQKFISEASAMAKVNNSFITAVYETGQGHGLTFYTGEYFGGADLKEEIEKGVFLTEEMALKVIINIGSALEYESRHQILHGPLFLEQVLIPFRSGAPKLLNNVVLEGATLSPGEPDEIQRMSEIILYGKNPKMEFSPEFSHLLSQMGTAKEAGFLWNSVVQSAKQIELNHKAMKAVRPVNMTELHKISDEPQSKKALWMTLIIIVLILGAAGYWYYYYYIPRGAFDTDTMVEVKEGPFIFQKDQQVTLPTFYIDKYEVTIQQYAKFLDAWKRNPSSIAEHPKAKPGKDHTPLQWYEMNASIKQEAVFNGGTLYENSPVFNIDFYDAWAYAHWAGKELPTEQEWEKAARGPNGNIYPWGNDWDPSYANSAADLRDNQLDPNFGKIDGFGLWAPVGAKPKDKSFYGAMDMAGNIQEWTDSWEPDTLAPKVMHPVLRGGSWFSADVRVVLRNGQEPSERRCQYVGFRCVSHKPPPAPHK